jgi:CheY-like chemotaxis protein
VRLPAGASPPLTAKSHARASHALSTRAQRVLVVDDNRDGAEMISDLLADAGHEVQVANDPSQALSLVDTFHPQVAILDIGLPVMDGYTLAQELRARLGAHAPILIALTGYGQDQDKRRSREAGFSMHLVKPVEGATLVHLIDALAPEA